MIAISVSASWVGYVEVSSCLAQGVEKVVVVGQHDAVDTLVFDAVAQDTVASVVLLVEIKLEIFDKVENKPCDIPLTGVKEGVFLRIIKHSGIYLSHDQLIIQFLQDVSLVRWTILSEQMPQVSPLFIWHFKVIVIGLLLEQVEHLLELALIHGISQG